MREIDKSVIEECAANLLFDLSPGQAELISDEFAAILAQMSYLSEIPGIDGVEPLTFPLDERQMQMRKDVPDAPLPAEEALKNVPHRLGNQVRIPKVVG